MFKKHMIPPTAGGQRVQHQGKGSQASALPDRRALAALASAPNAGLNDYAKATPMPGPSPAPTLPPGSVPGAV